MAPKVSRTPSRAIVEAQIDDNLRKIFEEDAGGPLPDHLRKLVERLEEVDAPHQPELQDAASDDEAEENTGEAPE